MKADTGTASDIAVGDEGDVWITCASQMKQKGINLMYYDFSTDRFLKATGYGHEITVTSQGQPLVTLENGEIFLKRGSDL